MRFSQIAIFLLTLILNGCGVEAGNPVDDDSETSSGQLSLTFAESDDVFGESFVLNLTGVTVSSLDDSGNTAASEDLSLSSMQVELFSLTEDSATEETATANLAPGTYDQITLGFSQEDPVSFTGENEDPVTLPFSSPEYPAIHLEQSITITEGQLSEIVISLDPRSSLTTDESTGAFKGFDPQLRSLRKGEGFTHKGTTGLKGAFKACAYFYKSSSSLSQGGQKASAASFAKLNRRRKRFGPSRLGRRPPEFSDPSSVIKDKVPRCPNAFAKATVRNGTYRFRYLKPGFYDIRVFASGGTYEDNEEGIQK